MKHEESSWLAEYADKILDDAVNHDRRHCEINISMHRGKARFIIWWLEDYSKVVNFRPISPNVIFKDVMEGAAHDDDEGLVRLQQSALLLERLAKRIRAEEKKVLQQRDGQK